MVALGLPLHRMKAIRQLYSEDPNGANEINFKSPKVPPKPSGHVIAARITSENPDEGFKPAGGTDGTAEEVLRLSIARNSLVGDEHAGPQPRGVSACE